MNHDTVYYIGQVTGILVTIGAVANLQLKKKQHMFILSIIVNILSALNILLLDGFSSGVIICLVALLVACFGIFFSGEDTGTGITMQTVVAEINTEYQAKIDEIKSSNTFNVVEISGLNPVWKDVMAVYAAKLP